MDPIQNILEKRLVNCLAALASDDVAAVERLLSAPLPEPLEDYAKLLAETRHLIIALQAGAL